MDFKNFNRRGQVLLFYALLVPLLMLFVGVGMDLGWYYFNVSRLQNAADAAALAGAQEIIEADDEFKNYDVDSIRLVENILGEEPYALTTAGDVEAATYVRKNLSPETMTEAVKEGNAYVMSDDWGLGSNTETTMTPSLYPGGGGNYYYVINLTENIRHFFLPGWFDNMAAPVVAVAILSPKTDTDDTEDPENPVVVPEEKIEEIETVINANVIVGNWEVQNYYRYLNSNSEDIDSETEKKVTRAEAFKARFGFEVYTSAWNMFQDNKVHYKNGDLYRRENIEVFDDVKLVDYDKTGASRYSDDNMASFGKTGNGDVKNPTANGSSVQKTQASSNGNDVNSYTYNTPGNPYVAEDLDSIDIDFQPEVGWKTDSVYPYQDWDLQFGYDKWANNHVDGSGRTGVGVGKRGNYGWSDHLRIHSTIDFGKPYPVRERIKESDPTDRDML